MPAANSLPVPAVADRQPALAQRLAAVAAERLQPLQRRGIVTARVRAGDAQVAEVAVLDSGVDAEHVDRPVARRGFVDVAGDRVVVRLLHAIVVREVGQPVALHADGDVTAVQEAGMQMVDVGCRKDRARARVPAGRHHVVGHLAAARADDPILGQQGQVRVQAILGEEQLADAARAADDGLRVHARPVLRQVAVVVVEVADVGAQLQLTERRDLEPQERVVDEVLAADLVVRRGVAGVPGVDADVGGDDRVAVGEVQRHPVAGHRAGADERRVFVQRLGRRVEQRPALPVGGRAPAIEAALQRRREESVEAKRPLPERHRRAVSPESYRPGSAPTCGAYGDIE